MSCSASPAFGLRQWFTLKTVRKPNEEEDQDSLARRRMRNESLRRRRIDLTDLVLATGTETDRGKEV
jgi:hypothetical protein